MKWRTPSGARPGARPDMAQGGGGDRQKLPQAGTGRQAVRARAGAG